MSNEIEVNNRKSEIQPFSFSEIERMANAIVKSGLFGVKTIEQALALLLLSQAEGIHPVCGARDYHIIQNRPSMKSETMLARFQANGGKVEWTSYSDKKVSGIFSHPSSGRMEFSWTIEKAKGIGLTSKDTWKHYPEAMLRSRVISEAIRTMLPGVLSGMYTDEEVESFTVIDANPAKEPFIEPKTKSSKKETAELVVEPKPEEPPVVKDVSETVSPEEREAVQLTWNERVKGTSEAIRNEFAADLKKKYGFKMFGDVKKKDLLSVIEDIQNWEPS